MHRSLIVASLGLAALAVGGCDAMHRHHAHHNHVHVDLGALTEAVCVLTPSSGSTVRGTVTFTQMGPNVKIVADVTGLDPNADHAWHIHEYGDIRAADGTATGGHYNPEGHPHGLPHDPDRHAGDLGNITADATGRGQKELTVMNCSIGGVHNPVLGRSIIVHAKVDDGGQPTGNAGARIAQGVIGVARSE